MRRPLHGPVLFGALGVVLAVVLARPVAPAAQGPATDAFLDVPVGGGPVELGPMPAGLSSVDAASCGACHERHFDEWARSVHRTATTNAVFQAEYGRRRRDFCARCHAPRPEVAHDGIDCATCHVRGGAVLATRVSGEAPHASRVAPALTGPGACARCHEFDFEHQPGERLQRTLGEWGESDAAAAGKVCQDCHFTADANDPSHHRHDAPGSRDAAMRERALTATAALHQEGARTTLALELSVAEAGHAVPTGDMFRRLEVSAWDPAADARPARAWLRRRFRVDRRGWHEVEDTRVPPEGTRTVTLDVAGRPARVAWAVHLWLLPRREARAAGIPEREVRLLMAAGEVTAPAERAPQGGAQAVTR